MAMDSVSLRHTPNHLSTKHLEITLHWFFAKLTQTDLLILDDFAMKVLDGQQLLNFMEIIEDRHG